MNTKRQYKRNQRSLLRSLITYGLPRSLKGPLFRSMLKIETQDMHNLEFQIAKTKQDLTAAFILLHDNYVRQGFMNPHPSGMRITKFHLLPSTTTLIAKHNEKVVGTVSLVRNGVFGSPIDKICDLSQLKKEGERFCEVSSLAVASEYSGQRGKILFPLLKYLYHYCTKSFGVDYLAIAVNPSWWDFYEHILLFKKIKNDIIEKYSFVNGAPAVTGLLDLRSAPVRYQSQYHKQPSAKNMFSFMTSEPQSPCEIPQKEWGSISYPVLTPELIQFFNNHSNVLESLSPFEKQTLIKLYQNRDFQKILISTTTETQDIFLSPRVTRYEVDAKIQLKTPTGLILSGDLRNVSLNGIMVRTGSKFNIRDEVFIKIKIPNFSPLQLDGRVVWSTPEGLTGIHLPQTSFKWSQFIDQHEYRQIYKPLVYGALNNKKPKIA